jgi:hypothetical protein
VQSIDQLLKIREGTLSLRGKILDLNDQVQSTGIKLVDKKKEVIESRRVLLNVELALETMQSCLFILDNATRVQSRIQSRKYYSALKLLDELEEKHLRNMTEFAFVKKMRMFSSQIQCRTQLKLGKKTEESIPATQESIRAAVLREMRDWLLQVKNQTGKVGKYAMSLAIKKNERAQEREGSNEDLEAADGMPDRESEEGEIPYITR